MMFAVVKTDYVKDCDSDYLDEYGGVLAIRNNGDLAEQVAQDHATRLAKTYAEENECEAVVAAHPHSGEGLLVLTNLDPWDDESGLESTCEIAVMRVFVVSVSDC